MQNTQYFYLLLPQESWFNFHVLKMLLAEVESNELHLLALL